MTYTIDALLQGKDVGRWYLDAAEHWEQCLQGKDATDPSVIAAVAGSEQMWFEKNCGTRYVGQEIMCVVGIARYYKTSNGFDDSLDEATAMVNGLIGSGCSVEIHSHARRRAEAYGFERQDNGKYQMPT